MKTFRFTPLMLTIFICVACFSFQNSFAQTGNYFAGTGAGAGNTGSYNTGVADFTLQSNNSGSYNSAFGYGSLYSNTTGYNNVAVGFKSLYHNKAGNFNIANGRLALYYNLTGAYNIAFGSKALYYNTTGSSNIATGYQALYSNTTGSHNIATGYQAMYSNTTGYNNLASGYLALYYNTTGYMNIAMGVLALEYNKTGFYNTAIGVQGLYNNSTGSYNVATGNYSLRNNTTGSYNTATGYLVLGQNTTGSYNIASGPYALNSNRTGNYNIASGYQALYSNTTGSYNIASGDSALYSNTTGSYNLASGDSALYSNTTGYNNTAYGTIALSNNTTGYNNTAIGYSAGPKKKIFKNTTAVGYNAIPLANNQVRIGNRKVTSIGGQVGWTSFSDARIKTNIKENVPGLAFINLLRPVTYHFNMAKENELLGIKNSDEDNSDNDIEKIDFTGFLAQEVDKAAQKIKYDFSGVDKSGDIMGLRYNEFVVPLVKAVQELSKQNADLQNQINELKSMITSGNQSSFNNQQSTVISSASLEQNIPNPFTNSTTINYSIPQKVASAQIIITDQSGKVLKQLNVSGGGKGSIKIDASTLASGAYRYSLYVDGKLIDTKQMVAGK